jgi:hypothetical protein
MIAFARKNYEKGEKLTHGSKKVGVLLGGMIG